MSGPIFEPDLLDEIARENEIQAATYAFNAKPTKGVGALCKAFDQPERPDAIAHLLHTVPGLLGKQIGEFLSRTESIAILLAYFLEMDLCAPFLDALRRALGSSLHLPSEGEQIDRIVQTWAHAWVRCNPTCKYTGEQAYILAFACVLLNTDLHAQAPHRKMTPAQFVENVRGAGLSTELVSNSELFQFYEAIKLNQFQVKKDTDNEFLALSGPKLKGILERRRGKVLPIWTPYFFVLTDGCLYYFRRNRDEGADAGPLGMIQLLGVRIAAVDIDQIQIAAETGTLQYVKFSRRRPMLAQGIISVLLRARSRKSRDKWLFLMESSRMFAAFTGDIGSTICDRNIGSSFSIDLPTDEVEQDVDINRSQSLSSLG
jgi:hypothetical protein